MIIYPKDAKFIWNLDNIRFLYPPDDFTGSFNNEKMQARHKALQDKKINEMMAKLASAENPLGAMKVLNPREHIPFLLNNLAAFQERNCLEEAFLYLYYQKNTPFAAAGDFDTWKFIIESCDAGKLYAQGSPFPEKKVIAYRGSATGISRGLSWTTSKKEAAWVLNRWADKDLGGGTVFSLEITRQDIMVYINDETRQEVILVPAVAEKANPIEITSV